MTPYLKIDHVDKTFNRGSRETEVLKDVSLSVEKGEYVSIIGHSGCGKSTLLNIVAGLLPVTIGAVIVDKVAVEAPGPDRAVVFQNHSLLPWLTVYENVRLAVDKVFRGKRSRAERHDWTLENLALVQMTHAKDKKPNEISGGMKQRVGLARALAMEPKVTIPNEETEVAKVIGGQSDLAYTVALEILPKIELGDFKGIKLERQVAEVTEPQVKEALDRIAEQNQRGFYQRWAACMEEESR